MLRRTSCFGWIISCTLASAPLVGLAQEPATEPAADPTEVPASAAPAAEAPAVEAAAEATKLEDIVVSAAMSRLPTGEGALPNTITVISREALEGQLAVTADLSQIIGNLVPSFSPSRQKLSSSGETLRGREPLYMIDGVPQSNPLRNGKRESYTIDPAMIERIEIIHGANALHGLGASGGIINIVTRKPAASGDPLARVTLGAPTATDYESDGVGSRASGIAGRDFGAFDVTLGTSWERRGLYYDAEGRPIGVDGTQGDLMDSESLSFFGKFGYDLAQGQRLQLMLNRFTLEGDGDYTMVPGDPAAGVPTSSARGPAEGIAPRNRVLTSSLSYTAAELGGGALRAQVFLQRFQGLYGGGTFANFQDPAYGASVYDQSQNVSNKTGAKLDWGLRGLPARGSAVLGLDLLRDKTYQELVHTDRKWVPETVYQSWAPFLQTEWWLGNAVALSGGLRYENGRLDVDTYRTLYATNPGSGGVTVDGGRPKVSDVLPNAGLIWYPGDALSLFVSYAEGYTMPDVGRVLRGISTSGQDVDTLLDLDPVISDNNEIGVDYDDGTWLAHVSAYRSDSERGARLVFDSVNNVYNVQRQRVEIRGWEVRGGWRPLPATRLDLGYAAARGRADTDADGAVDADLDGANIAPDRLNLAWSQSWAFQLSSRLQASHYFDRDFDLTGASTAQFDGYTTLDGHLALATRAYGDWTLGVENLTNTDYITYYSQTIGTDPESYFAGRGRTLALSWAYAF